MATFPRAAPLSRSWDSSDTEPAPYVGGVIPPVHPAAIESTRRSTREAAVKNR